LKYNEFLMYRKGRSRLAQKMGKGMDRRRVQVEREGQGFED
jgi:hypothetical protein